MVSWGINTPTYESWDNISRLLGWWAGGGGCYAIQKMKTGIVETG